MKSRSKMASKNMIIKYWISHMEDYIDESYICEVIDLNLKSKTYLQPSCFACGYSGQLQRCHILARCNGGADDASNLHLLCKTCHNESEFISGDAYWKWLEWQIESGSSNRFKRMLPTILVYEKFAKENGITDLKEAIAKYNNLK